MTQVARQIIQAMKKGHVMIMPYAEGIASAFYDLFNRFFTLVVDPEGGSSHSSGDDT